MLQMLMIIVKNVSVIRSFRIDEIQVFVDITLSNFNKPHTPSEIRQCQVPIHLTLET